jgi:ribosome recycling factor
MYNEKETKSRLADITEWLKKEYLSIRTGRATPAVLDSVTVDSYGAMMKIPQVASVSLDGPRSLLISPWDTSLAPEIEKKIRDLGHGYSVTSDDKGVRVVFPELTSENKKQLVKVVHQKHEDARVSVRGEREKSREQIKKAHTNGDINEDEQYRYMESLQKCIDDENKTLQELADKKETEITEV